MHTRRGIDLWGEGSYPHKKNSGPTLYGLDITKEAAFYVPEDYCVGGK